MDNEDRSQYQNRRHILKLLSDEEIARVSMAETAPGLSEGEEYLDLGDLQQGVRRALGTNMPMRRILPRKSVETSTWNDILEQLVERQMVRSETGA
jgi:hypothetical protein